MLQLVRLPESGSFQARARWAAGIPGADNAVWVTFDRPHHLLAEEVHPGTRFIDATGIGGPVLNGAVVVPGPTHLEIVWLRILSAVTRQQGPVIIDNADQIMFGSGTGLLRPFLQRLAVRLDVDIHVFVHAANWANVQPHVAGLPDRIHRVPDAGALEVELHPARRARGPFLGSGHSV